jgi:hypothetical protein
MTAYLSVGSRTDVEISLESASTIQGLVKETEPVSTMRVAVEEPDRYVEEVRERLPDRVNIRDAVIITTPPGNRG